MSTDDTTSQHIDAGAFGQWLAQAQAALRGNGGMRVPCGDCVGCCTSSYSIMMRPHDSAALDTVPARFLTGVPGMPYPHARMDPLPNGHCPMFREGKCSIYAARPQTCLDYDCRVLAAAGVDAGEDKPVISQRVQAWAFSYENEDARHAHEAISRAARFIMQHSVSFPAGKAPTIPSGIAVLALKAHRIFLNPTADSLKPEETASSVLQAAQTFDQGF